MTWKVVKKLIPMTSTIISFNAYLAGGLFENVSFPDGIDKDIAVTTILLNAGEFEPLYKDAEFMKMATENWARKWYQSFERWNLAFSEEYNPLHNYDRHEIVKESHDDATTSDMDSETTSNDTNTNTRSAYNSDEYEPHDRSQLDGKGTSKNNAKGTDKGTFDRDAHMYGNIGVTTSAQMLEGELEVRKNNLYNMIADCFATELCILVY